MFQKPIRRIREPGKSRRNGEKKRTQKIYLPDMASKFLAFSLVPLFPLIPNRSETRTRGASELKNFSATPNHQPDRDWEERWNGGCGCSGFSNWEQQPPLNLFPLMHAEVKRGKKELHVQVQNFSRNPVAIHSEPGGATMAMKSSCSFLFLQLPFKIEPTQSGDCLLQTKEDSKFPKK